MKIYDYNHKIKKLDILLSKQLSKALKQMEIPFTDTQAELLMYLFHHPDQDIYQRDLTNILGISGPTGNGIVKRLVDKKAILLVPNPSDSRLKRLTLASNIRADIESQQDDFVEIFSEMEARMTVGFSDQDRDKLEQLLKLAISNLQSHS